MMIFLRVPNTVPSFGKRDTTKHQVQARRNMHQSNLFYFSMLPSDDYVIASDDWNSIANFLGCRDGVCVFFFFVLLASLLLPTLSLGLGGEQKKARVRRWPVTIPSAFGCWF